jgi:hypothetical protein
MTIRPLLAVIEDAVLLAQSDNKKTLIESLIEQFHRIGYEFDAANNTIVPSNDVSKHRLT